MREVEILIATFAVLMFSAILVVVGNARQREGRKSIYPAVFVVGLLAMALILLSFFIWPPGTL